MKKIVLDNTDTQLIIHNTPSGSNYVVTSAGIEGLEFPEIRISSQMNPGQHGEFISSNWYAGRIITIPVAVFGSTAAAYNTNRKALIEALKFEADSDGQAVYKEIEFTDDDDEVYTTSYITGALRITRKYPKFCEGFITLRCPDPALLGADESSSVTLSEGGGFDIGAIGTGFDIGATGTGFDIDSQIGGSITIINDGDIDAYPIIVIRGPLTSPTVSNATTGKSLQLETISLSAGDSISIDMKNRTITHDKTNDYFQYKTSASDFWSLQPGSNVINFIDSTYDSRAQATVSHNDYYSGI